jgi:hypothetical protein
VVGAGRSAERFGRTDGITIFAYEGDLAVCNTQGSTYFWRICLEHLGVNRAGEQWTKIDIKLE